MRVGNDLVITGGFTNSVFVGTTRTTALDLSNPNAQWRELKPNPIDFWTHGGHATKGDNLMYICGGYLGAHMGDDFADCYYFDKSKGSQGEWFALPSIPQPRGGGALLYINQMDSLLYTLGAVRFPSIDMDTTWMLDLSVPGSDWVYMGPSPYQGNHVSAISATDCEGNIRHFVLGGQKLEDEWKGNIDLVYEYLPMTNEFVRKADMLEKKGHFTTALAPYGCGFIIVGGAINKQGGGSTSNVDYYSINEDKWTTIGSYVSAMKTMVCGTYNDEITCSTGYTQQGWKRTLSFPPLSTPTPPSPPPPTPPTPTPPAPTPPAPTPPTPTPPATGAALLQSDFNSGADGFQYMDDPWALGHSAGNEFASGTYAPTEGITGGALYVKLGGQNTQDIFTGMSGGFSKSFNMPTSGSAQITFSYRVWFSSEYEMDEYAEVLCMVGGSLIGPNGNGYVAYTDVSLGHIPWTTVTLDVGFLSQGTHDLVLGGHNNKKTHGNERTDIYFDDVLVTSGDAPAGPPADPPTNLDAPAFLTPGDVAIVQYNADGADDFAFVATVQIAANTEILFTDNGWLKNGGFRQGEGILKWTASTAVGAGTVVTIVPSTGSSTTGWIMQVSGNLDLNGWGDQLIAYQEFTPTSFNLLFAVNNQGSAKWQRNAGSVAKSANPPDLPSYAKVALQEIDNTAYSGVAFGSRMDLLVEITNPSNWVGKNWGHYTTVGPFVIW